MNSGKHKDGQSEPANRTATHTRSRNGWLTVVVIAIVLVAVIAWRMSIARRTPALLPAEETAQVVTAPAHDAPAATPGRAAPGQIAPVPDAQKLVGRWVRIDAPYVIDIASATEDGTLEAAYYNPRPINVARAEWQETEGTLEVFIELRDVNYPGSTYTIRLDPTADRLHGIYFQATMRESYDITFMRDTSRQ